MSERRTVSACLLITALAASACGSAVSDEKAVRPTATKQPSTAARISRTPQLVASTPTAATPTPRSRSATAQVWAPFASVGGVTLRYPSARVELVAFHQANHEGARQLEALPGVAAQTLETRDRLTGPRTAADVVVDPAAELRAPVTGRVMRAGTYVLYCDYSDDFLVIAPDDRPGWEVKILHIDGVLVRAGDRVVAGQTVIAPRPTRLPFESQVDEISARPAWPHVHVEVVDPSIPNRPSPGGGCN